MRMEDQGLSNGQLAEVIIAVTLLAWMFGFI